MLIDFRRPFVIQGLENCLILRCETDLTGAFILISLLSLLQKVEKAQLTFCCLDNINSQFTFENREKFRIISSGDNLLIRGFDYAEL